MSTREIALWAILSAFSLFTLAVGIEMGLAGFMQSLVANGATLQVLLDLGIMLVIFFVWMLRDARENGRNPWPFAIAMCCLGSIGAMAYLIYRERVGAEVRAST